MLIENLEVIKIMEVMSVPGLESAVHVFFALLSALTAVAMLALVYKRVDDRSLLRVLGIALALFVWLAWISAAPVYIYGYSSDKNVIVSFNETKAAHKFGMETKEHIFYTGLILATLVPIALYSVDPVSNAGRRILLWILISLVIGFVIMDALGAWIAAAAKQAWAIKAGGG